MTITIVAGRTGSNEARRCHRTNASTSTGAGRDEPKRLYCMDDQLGDEIVRYREEHGGFRKVEDVQDVPGLGPDWFQNDAGGQIKV